MAKYYIVSDIAGIKATLLDYYGAYDSGTNPDGVLVHTDSSSLIIFSCSAISDKVIKITGFSDLIAYYGDAYSGSDITNPVAFGGTTTTGTTSSVEMVCGDSFILFSIFASTLNHRLWIIGQLTNNQFACIGFIGTSNATNNVNAMGYLTASNTVFWLAGLSGDYQVGSKRAISQLAIVTASGALYSGADLVGFKDVYSVSRQLGVSASAKGTGYYLTPSGGYTNATYLLTNSLMVEVTN